jgi:pyruvate,orthophosphate dikinase
LFLGVVYSRNPSSGSKQICGEYYEYCEDSNNEACRDNATPVSMQELFRSNIQLFSQCQRVCQRTEEKYRDAQTIEFEVENRRLFVAKSWASSRSPEAALTIALDLALENLITMEEAILRIKPDQVNWLIARYFLSPHLGIQPTADHYTTQNGTGANPDSFSTLGFATSASNGIAVGRLVLDEKEIPGDENFIALVDCFGSGVISDKVLAASGFLCLQGGISSPLACYARKAGKPLVTCCSKLLHLTVSGEVVTTEGLKIKPLQVVSIDGSSGAVCLGNRLGEFTFPSDCLEKVNTFLRYAKPFSELSVIATIDELVDVTKAEVIDGLSGLAVLNLEEVLAKSEIAKLLVLFCWIMLRAEDSLRWGEALVKLNSILSAYFENFFDELFISGTSNAVYFVRLMYWPEAAEEYLSEDSFAELQLFLKKSDEVVRRDEPLSDAPVARFETAVESLLQLQIRALHVAVLKQARDDTDPESNFEVFVSVGSGQQCNAIPTIFETVKNVLISESRTFGEEGDRVNWSVGCILEVPAACPKAVHNISAFISSYSAIKPFVCFDVGKMLPLIVGVNGNVFPSGTLKSSGMLELLSGIVRRIRCLQGGSVVKFCVIGTGVLSTLDLSVLSSEFFGDFLIVPLKEAAGAVVAAAQVALMN